MNEQEIRNAIRAAVREYEDYMGKEDPYPTLELALVDLFKEAQQESEIQRQSERAKAYSNGYNDGVADAQRGMFG